MRWMVRMAIGVWVVSATVGSAKPIVWAEEIGGFQYEGRGVRDPFVPLVTPEGRVPGAGGLGSIEDLVLEGVVWDPSGKSVAIINGVVVQEGEKLDGIDVVSIQNGSVTLRAQGREFVLQLVEEGGDTSGP